MKLTPELIETLALTAEDEKIFSTPLARLSKTARTRAFEIGDKISEHIWAIQDAEREAEKRKREEAMEDEKRKRREKDGIKHD